jgi:hypothetical protein
MTIEYSTPALLFPALSLILLAYTNRFVSLSKLIRGLHATYIQKQDQNILAQLKNLRRRIILIRNMTATGIGAIFLCVGCMFLIHSGYNAYAVYVLSAALMLMLFSLGQCMLEIVISTHALMLELSDIQEDIDKGNHSFGQTLISLNPLNKLKGHHEHKEHVKHDTPANHKDDHLVIPTGVLPEVQ